MPDAQRMLSGRGCRASPNPTFLPDRSYFRTPLSQCIQTHDEVHGAYASVSSLNQTSGCVPVEHTCSIRSTKALHGDGHLKSHHRFENLVAHTVAEVRGSNPSGSRSQGGEPPHH